ncbi:MAG: hypothetical protein DHS20C15_31980 [Planctomycetota bacterium]|nr:MAG: hypothetical protein DHS20C15_31980 [Planctomycetota bacterium]
MTTQQVRIDGELYLSVETVAEVYAIKSIWLHEVCDAGLLPGSVDHDAGRWIAAIELDRVAAIVRLRAVIGNDVDAISALLSG